MIDLLKDISEITNVPKLTLEKISAKGELCIADAVVEVLARGDSQVTLDIGIGTLTIRVSESEVKYKFIPSTRLDTTILRSITLRESPLIPKLDNALVARIQATYKELIL